MLIDLLWKVNGIGMGSEERSQKSDDVVGPLSYETQLETDAVAYKTTHSMWGMIRLHTMLSSAHYHSFPEIPTEFIVVVDTSASMATDNKVIGPCM